VLGRNGSGKTTVLKMMNGLLKPDRGTTVMDGRVRALINLSAGFNMALSGRDNSYNSASLMGLTRKEIDELVAEIIDFSELEDSIDSPVGTYSSGMSACLGFSVAISLRSDILLVDEILAVGDYSFQNKCFAKLHEFKGSTQANKLFCEELRGYTMVFVVGSKEARPPEFACWQTEADAFGTRLEIKMKLSDAEKFREIKRSKLVLFPSFFEGFGYPPIEAQYCDVPCIAFDLPVVRETNGDGVYYVPIGYWAAFQKKFGEVLRSPRDHSWLREHIARLDAIVGTLMQRPARAAGHHRPAQAQTAPIPG
jgi:glycosyltransferase involved in cell wall biosynthesis